MTFCPNCGTQAAGTFCPNCGAQLGGSSAGTSAGYSSRPSSGIGQTSGLTQNVASALCYALGFVTGIIFLVLPPYNRDRTVRFHAFQSIFLNIAFLILTIALPMVGHVVGFGLLSLVDLAGFVLWIYIMFSVYNGKRVKLPVIGDLAEKQAGS